VSPARSTLLSVFIASCGLGASAAWAERVHRYAVAPAADLRSLQVTACFDGAAPRELSTEFLDAPAAFVSGRVRVERGAAIAPNGTDMALKGVPDDGCIEYVVNLAGGYARHDSSGRGTERFGRDVATRAGLWFWRPATLGPEEDIEVSFRMPDGMSVSAPWRPVSPAREVPTYRVGHGAYDRPATVAFGRFQEQLVEVPGATLRLAVLDGSPPADVGAMRAWIEDAARSLASVTGRFPVASPQILVMPGAPQPEPAPWAYVMRGGQPAALFRVNQRRPLHEYVEDWTAPHELSHFLLPYISLREGWLSEGMATYYQNVSRARSGALSPEEAWQRIHSGLTRGRALAQGDVTLAQATERLFRGSSSMRGGGYMRVYWSGAAMLLIADMRLRARSDNRESLDTVLAAFAECCLDPDAEWTARQVFEKLDALSGSDVFRTLYDRYVDSPSFPDIDEVYAQLGLVALGGKVELAATAPLVHVRDAIMAPGEYRTPGGPAAAR
jgi:hypothetical protein